MWLIVGLGNPGNKYAKNRHNIGFMLVDALAAQYQFSSWRPRFQGEISSGQIQGNKILLLKPHTYMNESGRAAGEALRYHRLASTDMISIHDDLDLTPGQIRFKRGGGHGGHNGLRSIDAHVGADFYRLRVGIGRPTNAMPAARYVLNDFASADRDWLETMRNAIVDQFPLLIKGDHANFLNRVAMARGKLSGERPSES